MESTTKKRTREEVRAAFKEAMRKKQEWIEESNVFLEQIHKKKLAGLIWTNLPPLNRIDYEQT